MTTPRIPRDYRQILAKYPSGTKLVAIARAEGIVYSTLQSAIKGLYKKPQNPNFVDLLEPLFRGRTDTQIAEASGTHQQTISSWRTGKNSPRLSDLMKVCRAFGLTLTFIEHHRIKPVLDRLEELRGTGVTGDFVCTELTDMLIELMEEPNA